MKEKTGLVRDLAERLEELAKPKIPQPSKEELKKELDIRLAKEPRAFDFSKEGYSAYINRLLVESQKSLLIGGKTKEEREYGIQTLRVLTLLLTRFKDQTSYQIERERAGSGLAPGEAALTTYRQVRDTAKEALKLDQPEQAKPLEEPELLELALQLEVPELREFFVEKVYPRELARLISRSIMSKDSQAVAAALRLAHDLPPGIMADRLLPLLKDSDPKNRRAGIYIFSQLPQEAWGSIWRTDDGKEIKLVDETVPSLLALLEDPDLEVRERAVSFAEKALGSFKEAILSETLVPHFSVLAERLLEKLKDEESSTRRQAG